MTIKFAYQHEIVEALKSAESDLELIKEKYEYFIKYVETLKKSITCEHNFDKGESGWTQIGYDECSKCGWVHNY